VIDRSSCSTRRSRRASRRVIRRALRISIKHGRISALPDLVYSQLARRCPSPETTGGNRGVLASPPPCQGAPVSHGLPISGRIGCGRSNGLAPLQGRLGRGERGPVARRVGLRNVPSVMVWSTAAKRSCSRSSRSAESGPIGKRKR
jgi:hypothetical protein